MSRNNLAFKNFVFDLGASVAVFFVAISLCIGIAHASNAPMISGIIGGVIGGLVVGSLSKSSLSVSGPAAGLATITIHGIEELGSFEAFLCALILAGIIQIILGFLKVGFVSEYFPNSVIKGMLAAIGLILIFKQIPHLLGYDVEVMGSQDFLLDSENIRENFRNLGFEDDNTFSVFFDSIMHIAPGACLIGLSSLIFLLVWDHAQLNKKFQLLPSGFIAVIIGIGLNILFINYMPFLVLKEHSLVHLPDIANLNDFFSKSPNPDFYSLTTQFNKIIFIAISLALVASLEALLSINAIDKIDPEKRETPANRELIAQGVGNLLCGFFGAIPLTSVVVRSSVNLTSGAKTKLSAILHGFFLVISILFFSEFINSIPLASLAAVLVHTGLKLNDSSIYKSQFNSGFDQTVPFLITIASVLLIDLLIGVLIGLAVGAFFIIKNTYEVPVVSYEDHGDYKKITTGEHLNFIQKHKIKQILNSIGSDCVLEIDNSRTIFIDHDIQELLMEFSEKALSRNIVLRIEGKSKWIKRSKTRLFLDMKKQFPDFIKRN